MSPLLCEKAYRKDRRGLIYCRDSGIVCAHQFWCDISVEYKHFPEAATCPGRGEKGDERRKAGARSPDKL